MSVLSAVADGCQRVLRAPALILGLWIVSLTVPAPVDLAMADARAGVVEATAMDPVPALLAMFRSYEMLLHGVLATFLLGGLMDRLARDRATASFGFFGACGMFLFRFLRLDLLVLPFHVLAFLWLSPRFTGDEPFASVLFAAALAMLHVCVDYARVRMVVEDRRSAIGALTAAIRFVARNVPAVLILWLINAVLAGGTWWIAAAFDVGVTMALYAYLLARALLRLIFIASQLSLFQSRLAHAGYTARQVAAWPDSPAADAVLPR
jgi:hypothetical protein